MDSLPGYASIVQLLEKDMETGVSSIMSIDSLLNAGLARREITNLASSAYPFPYSQTDSRPLSK